jgi:hypothetical protein
VTVVQAPEPQPPGGPLESARTPEDAPPDREALDLAAVWGTEGPEIEAVEEAGSLRPLPPEEAAATEPVEGGPAGDGPFAASAEEERAEADDAAHEIDQGQALEAVPTAPEAWGPDERRQEVLSALTRARRGLEAPARLFQLLGDELGLRKAALLLYDPLRLVFAPWAACGYDQTTLQRLRIPMGYNGTFDRMAGGETLHFSEPSDLAQLRPLFSFREFSTLQHAVFVPFLHTRKWIAIFVSTEQSPAPWGSDPAFYATVAERAAELLYEARERHLEAVSHDGDFLESLRRELLVRPTGLRPLMRRSAEEAVANGKPFVVIRFDLRTALSVIHQAAPSFVPFRLGEDLCGMVLALFRSLGTAVRPDPDHLLLLLDQVQPTDQELLFRHLEGVLRFYFPSLADREDLGLAPQVRVWRGAPGEADQVLDSFDS